MTEDDKAMIVVTVILFAALLVVFILFGPIGCPPEMDFMP